MASYNRVIMMGNLTRDPECKQLNSGQMVCKLGLASNRQFKNRQTGDMVQEVCFVDIDVWGAQAESCSKYLQKGRGVLIEGRLKLDSWVDNTGNKRSKHSIVADRVTFLPSAAQVEDPTFGDSKANSFNENNSSQFGSSQTPSENVSQKADSSLNTFTVNTGESTVNTGEVNLKDEKPFEDELPF